MCQKHELTLSWDYTDTQTTLTNTLNMSFAAHGFTVLCIILYISCITLHFTVLRCQTVFHFLSTSALLSDVEFNLCNTGQHQNPHLPSGVLWKKSISIQIIVLNRIGLDWLQFAWIHLVYVLYSDFLTVLSASLYDGFVLSASLYDGFVVFCVLLHEFHIKYLNPG